MRIEFHVTIRPRACLAETRAIENITESVPGDAFVQGVDPRGKIGDLLIPVPEISMVLYQEQRFSEEQVESATKNVDRVSSDKQREAFIIQYRHIQQVSEAHGDFGVAGRPSRAVHRGQKVVGF